MPSTSVRFKGSEYVQVEATIYPAVARTNHRSLLEAPFPEIAGFRSIRLGSERFADDNSDIAVIGLSYSHQINTAAPTCTLTVKARGVKGAAFLDVLQPNDWIDVVIRRHEKKFHVFRGRIQATAIETSSGAIGGAATQNTLRIRCRGFGHILEQTQVYYDIVSEGIELAAAYPRILITKDNTQDVASTLKSLLFGFLKEGEEGTGRSLWKIPPALPGANGTGDTFFHQMLTYFPDTDDRAIDNFPERINSQSLNWITPAQGGESLWTILQRWNDAPLVDLYTDLVSLRGLYLKEGEETTPESTSMAVIVRDKPFPTVTNRGGARVLSPSTPGVDRLLLSDNINKSRWFDDDYLPAFNIDWSDITSRNVVRSDEARKNAFFIAPVLTQNLTPTLLNLQAPLWDTEDIQTNGFRPVFYSTPYFVDLDKASQDYNSLMNLYRQRLRDFMTLGYHYLSGNIEIGFGRPDIRVGSKLIINAAGEQENSTFQGEQLGGVFEERYHVEGVSHTWAPVTGMRTALTVTRGIRGDDSVRRQLLLNKIEKYTLAKFGEANLA